MTEYRTPVIQWSCDDVAEWLKSNGFIRYVKLFTEQHKINGEVLLLMTEDDLRLPPLSITVLGDIKRIILALKVLKLGQKTNEHSHDGISDRYSSPCLLHREVSVDSEEDLLDMNSFTNRLSNGHAVHSPTAAVNYPNNRSRISQKLNAEPIKLLISFCYMFLVFMLTAFTMVIVHDRVPDMDKYPPLPDIVLDNLPYISWAFEACEATAIILSLILLATLLFHKHRFIIMRRMFALTGTVFMLRCITMLITSLSVPGTHLLCEPKMFGDLTSKLKRAFVIWTGFGMSLQGVRTCGDYMFSGHTIIVTLLNFFITEYTPRRVPMLHTASWIMNIFAVFFILAAHEHYSIDVFVAFYITSRLFLYYHSLANNRVLQQPDHMRTRTWFPMFSFFESSIDGIVPNEYESPITSLKRCLPELNTNPHSESVDDTNTKSSSSARNKKKNKNKKKH